MFNETSRYYQSTNTGILELVACLLAFSYDFLPTEQRKEKGLNKSSTIHGMFHFSAFNLSLLSLIEGNMMLNFLMFSLVFGRFYNFKNRVHMHFSPWQKEIYFSASMVTTTHASLAQRMTLTLNPIIPNGKQEELC